MNQNNAAGRQDFRGLVENTDPLHDEERFSSIFNGAAIGIIICDLHGTVLEGNLAFRRMLGYTTDELCGVSLAALSEPSDENLERTLLEQLFSEQREEFQIETCYRRKNSGSMWGRLTVSLLRDRGGKPQYALGMVEDISSRKQVEIELHRSERRYRLLVEQSPDAILVYREGIYLYANPAAVRLFGAATQVDLVGRKVLDLVAAESKEKFARMLEQILAHGALATPMMEMRMLRLDGHATEIESSSRLIDYEGLPAIQAIMRDITERKNVERQLQSAQQKLQAYAGELELRVAERTARLQESLSSQEMILYHVTHDLRAPLRAIHGFIDLVIRTHAEKLEPEVKEFLDRSLKASHKMDRMIGELLEVGRVGYQKITLGPVELSAVLEQVLGALDQEVKARKGQVDVSTPLPRVFADHAILERILTNLLHNALKFVPPERNPHIQVWVDDHREWVRLNIRDNGIGIAPEDQEKIFEPFARSADAKSYPGTGVGLAVVRKGLERMGGHIEVDSKLGEGTRFCLQMRAS